MTRRLLGLLGVAMAISGCGGDDTPSAPSSPATPTVNTLTISGYKAILTGTSANYTATAQLSNGTNRSVTPAWSTSNPSVASVDNAGRVEGLTHGEVNLAASYQGQSASMTVNVVHNYAGNWNGTYVIRACDESGVFADLEWCVFGGGSVAGANLQYSLALTQGDEHGIGLNEVTGNVSLYDLPGNISGHVTSDGRLVIGGTYLVTSEDVTFEMTIGGWDTRPAAGDSMSGGWALSLRAIGLPGNAYEEHRIVSATHTTLTPTVSVAPDRYVLSLTELFKRMGR
jgi:hypothetical protein